MINLDMISIAQPYQWKKFVVVIVAILTIVVSAMVLTHIVRGYSGSSGPATGGAPACGGIWSRDGKRHNNWPNSNCGTAWIKYPASGGNPLPSGFKNGTSWTGTIVPTCSVAGSVVVFVYFSANGTYGRPEESYDYSPDVNYSYNNFAASGWAYKDLGSAQADFNSTPSNQRSGNRWGIDVGWFCYNDNPPWNVTVTSNADKTIAEPGEVITWTHTVTNSGANKTNKNVTWHYQNRGTDWPNTTGTDWTVGSGCVPGLCGTNTSMYQVVPADVGKRLCRSTSASPQSNTDASWIESSPTSCVVIAKKPKVNILGSDLVVGPAFTGSSVISGTNTSLTQKVPVPPATTGGVFGSWVEYGIFATGNVIGTGSGSAFGGAGGGNSTKQCTYSLLSFVNATSSTPLTSCSTNSTIGSYSTNRTIPDILSNFPVQAGVTPVYDDTAATPQGIYTSNDHGSPVVSDPITLGPRTLNKGQWVVINAPNADVTITGNITYYGGQLQSIYDIPQLVIIAKNIHIAANVTQVDAWLIAKGSAVAGTGIIDTCAIDNNYATQLTTNLCNNPLQVNGPVMSQKLWLRRTAGSSLGGTPAETFNMRPDAYLWSFARASVSGRVQTVTTKELPPRF